MSLPTHRMMNIRTMPAAALALALVLSACSEPAADGEPPDGAVSQTALAGGTADNAARLTGEDIQEDRERFVALDDQLRTEFSAFDDDERLGPVLTSLHLCSVLYADQANERDVQQRYEHFLAGFTGEGYVSHETGRHWVDRSIGEFCPDLEPQLVR